MKKLFSFIITVVFCSYSSVAQDIPPELLNANIINEKGDVKLTWELKDTVNNNIAILRDSVEYVSAYIEVQIIRDTSILTWINKDSRANNQPRSYRVEYNKDTTNDETVPLKSNRFNTIHTSLKFDTCRKQIKLKWTKHIEANFNDTISIEHYNIWKKVNNSNYRKVYTKEDNKDTTFTDKNVNYNDSLKYYIEAVRASDTSIKSHSNRVSIYTRMPYEPDYINPDLLEVRNNNINLQYTIAENSELKEYKLLRSENYEGTYDTVHTFNTSKYTLNYTDDKAAPSNNIYYYYVAAINQCNHLTTKSDTTNNILLKLDSENEMAVLNWNKFQIAPAKVTYKIFRKNGTNPYSNLSNSYSVNYTDSELDLFTGRDSSGKFCYYIKAHSQLNEGQNSQSISSKKCIYIKPGIFIPNAFTPNGDGKNDRFRPVLSFLPQEYRLIIYNRKGNKVFETTNPEKPWEGNFQGQHKVSAGTYIYYLEVKNPNHELIRRRGEINVLYP